MEIGLASGTVASNANGQPKYKIDFSGKGCDIFPTIAKGITRVPKRWCTYNGDLSDMEMVKKE